MVKRKVAVIGLDSITPVMIERFLAEGHMPNLQRLRDRGWSSEITPTMPATTPAGWTTVATGAWPSTHGIEGFAIHTEGEPLDKKTHALSSDRVKAEFIWQAAEKANKKTILLKYPMSWPPVGGENVLQVDGAGGWGGLKCVWDLVHSGCWDTIATVGAHVKTDQTVGKEEWLTRDQDNLDDECVQRLIVSPPKAWSCLPEEATPLWETQLNLRSHGMTEGVTLYILAIQIAEQAHLIIAQSRDEANLVLLCERDWSPWLQITLPTTRGICSGHVRLKVMQFDVAQQKLRLYQTQVHQEDGFTRPESVAADLMSEAGPFVEWTESYDLLQGWIDDETQLEIYEQHVDWMIRASRYLLREHEWDLFMTQVHFVDMAYHIYWGAVDPEHPQYDARKAPVYWDLLVRVHALVDRFLGALLEIMDAETLVVVLGDHGHDLYHTTFLVNNLLLREGFLALYRDPQTGSARIDWKRTRAYANGYRVYLNVAGRDPQGIVSLHDYDTLQEQLIQILYRAQDPRTRQQAVRLVVRREDAASLGLYGGTMGDVLFAMAPGFQIRGTISLGKHVWIGQRLQTDQVAIFQQTQLFAEFTGEHDTAFPFTRAIRTLLFLDGPGIRPGVRRVPVRMVDIAPTLCCYLGIPFPSQCEGSPVYDAFQPE